MKLSPVEEVELRWFWTEALGEMGLRSSFGHQLERARTGQLYDQGSRVGNPNIERMCAVSRRFGVIAKKLASIPWRHERALKAYLCGHNASGQPPAGLVTLGPLGSVVPLTAKARDAYSKSGRKRPKEPTLVRFLAERIRQDKDLRSELLIEADALMSKAIGRWRDGRG